MDFWLEEITKAADQELAPILERWSRLKPWATLPAVKREELAETISKQAADIFVDPGQEQKARHLFELALGIAPVSARVFLLQGVALYKKAEATGKVQDLLSAKAKFKRALSLLPSFEEARFWLCQSAMASYEQQQELAALEESKKLLFDSKDLNSSLFPWQTLKAKWFWFWANHFSEPADYLLAISEIEKTLEFKSDPELECYWALSTMKLIHAFGEARLIDKLIGRLDSLTGCSLNFSAWQSLALSCHDLCSTYGNRALLRVCKKLWKRAHETSHYFSFALFEKRAAINLILIELEPSAQDLKEFECMLKERTQVEEEEAKVMSLWKFHARLCWFENSDKIPQLKQLLKQIDEYRQRGMLEPHYWLVRGGCQLAIANYFKDLEGVNEAMETFQKGLSIDSDRPGLWLKLGKACLVLSDIQPESEASRRATNIFPFALACGRYDWRFWMDWALALFRMADATGDRIYLSEAIVRFEKALEMASRDEKEIDAHLLYLYGTALDFLGDLSREEIYYERAIEKLQTAVLKDPSHPQASLALAVAMTHAGEALDNRVYLEKASAIFEGLAVLDHEDEYLWNEWAVCVLSLCRLDIEEGETPYALIDRAIVMLNKAYCLGNQHALYNLCCAYSLRKDSTRALGYLEKAFETGAHPPIEDMIEDEWLDEIRGLDRFGQLLDENKKEKDEPEGLEGSDEPEKPDKDPDTGNLTAS